MPNLKLLAKIHIAKKELGLDDDTYRDALHNLFGKSSAKDLTNWQISRAITHFKRLGWKPSNGSGKFSSEFGAKKKKYDDLGERDAYAATPPQLRMIEAMWHDIYRGNDETKHLRQFLFNHFRISELRFLGKKTAHDVIEALKAMQKRR